MTANGNKKELDEFYDEGSKRNLPLQMKNPFAWYNAAQRWMLLANMMRSRIERDNPAENEGETEVVRVLEPSRSGDIYWLQILSAAIKNDIVEDNFVGNLVNVEAEETIDKRGIDIMPEPRYRRLHHLYPLYLYFVGAAMESLLKAIYVMQHTDSIYSNSDPEIGRKIIRWRHNLYPLAKDGLQLQLTEAEEHLLRMLQEFVEWAGKYPGPTSPERYADFVRGKHHPNPFSAAERANYSNGEIAIHDLYKRLLQTLDNEAKKRLEKLND